jgi:hypothetical protein
MNERLITALVLTMIAIGCLLFGRGHYRGTHGYEYGPACAKTEVPPDRRPGPALVDRIFAKD